MSQPIESYAMIGDRRTAALVGMNGSIDWLCVPRFDSTACFAALLGDEENGRWQLCPIGEYEVSRTYVENSAALQTTYTTPTGVVTLLDVMPTGDDRIDVVRRITGVKGTVRMHHEWVVRFDYGTARPWVRRRHEDTDEPAITAVVGPDKLVLRGPRLPQASDHRHMDDFDVEEGEILTFSMTWLPSHLRTPPPHSAHVDETIHDEVTWVARLDLTGVPHPDVVRRSLLTLHLMTHVETGGIVAAPTTSLPEDFGGERNWDYRYCWLRDAALTIASLIEAGATEEARFWRDWLLRAVAGDPADLQIMYTVDGARHLPELDLDDLPGYAGSLPVRIGNGAVGQQQTDVIGEVMLALEAARESELGQTDDAWNLQRVLVDHLAETWQQRDNGLWEIRGELRHFTHSRVMVWAAFDRAVRAVERHHLKGDVDRWRTLRDRVRDEVMTKGFDDERQSFRQHYDTTEVDAALLMLPLVGFIDAGDPRMLGTIKAIEEDLLRDGLLLRYRTASGVDGLSGDEHPFLACSFWLASAYAGAGRLEDARALFDRLVGLTNDVGLLSEEYDAEHGRMVGNFPQAFSHLALVQAAFQLREAADGRG
ncbi:MAG TPA: glycoside hydrolase family 15 protein [Nocardioides sp.]|nr:glycoside hydrolase family 15 protein [Nocardioides sp.]